ncbi:MAG: hypothetical protein D8M58_20825 [Calditrichaeota bacterium]|nr:MAG: hypothetical protein DWQ03_01155 [Calditrichota bacterium]MBL1207856.1 hypothetical protein [Calditrichota bacterium]NOG47690.1 hypothetical protein [Calditrichota bacterium]
MTNLYLNIFLIILSAVFHSCSLIYDSDSKNEQHPIFSENFSEQYDYFIILNTQHPTSLKMYMQSPFDTISVDLNGKNAYKSNFSDRQYGNKYTIYTEIDSNIINTHENVNFVIKFLNKSYSGSINRIVNFLCDFSDIKSGNSHVVSWNSYSKIDKFEIQTTLIDENGDIIKSKLWQLSGENRKFEIPESYFDTKDGLWILITVYAANYFEKKNFYFLTYNMNSILYKLN